MQKLTRTTSYTLKEIGVYLLKKKSKKGLQIGQNSISHSDVWTIFSFHSRSVL